MTDTEAALLRAVAANPTEDTPRLVYADYLDEDGEPSRAARAEFIRLHVRAAHLPSDDPERPAVLARIDRLLYDWDTVWQREMPPGCKTLAYHRRGFAYRGAVVASQVTDTDDPRLHLFEYLELTPDVPSRRLAEVLQMPVFARVRELVIRGDRLLGWSGTRAFAEAAFPRLERLVLARQSIGNVGLRALCDSWGLPRLHDLDLSDNDITDDGLATLIRSSLILRLRRVELFGNRTSAAMHDRVRPGHREW